MKRAIFAGVLALLLSGGMLMAASASDARRDGAANAILSQALSWLGGRAPAGIVQVKDHDRDDWARHHRRYRGNYYYPYSGYYGYGYPAYSYLYNGYSYPSYSYPYYGYSYPYYGRGYGYYPYYGGRDDFKHFRHEEHERHERLEHERHEHHH